MKILRSKTISHILDFMDRVLHPITYRLGPRIPPKPEPDYSQIHDHVWTGDDE